MAKPSGGGNPQQQQTDINVPKLRSLVSQVKENTANLLRIAAVNIKVQVEADVKPGEDKSQGQIQTRIDTSLESLFSTLNQVELYLKTIQECAFQQEQSQKYMPYQVNVSKTDVAETSAVADNTLSYNQYITTVRNQIAVRESLQKMLMDAANKMN